MAETAVAIPPEGTKRMSEEDLWSLVIATMRLRLTASSLAGLKVAVSIGDPGDPGQFDSTRAGLRRRAADLATFYERIATQVGPSGRTDTEPVAVPLLGEHGEPDNAGADNAHPRLLWVYEYLHHLSSHAQAIPGPAARLAAQRRVP
jgi:hypothetical protein